MKRRLGHSGTPPGRKGSVRPKAKPSDASVSRASVLVDDAGRPLMLPLVEAARLALDDFRAEHGEFE